jgi:hypothetical protein
MITGFERIVEERIARAQREGVFDDLPGAGKPLEFSPDDHIAEDLRLPYKILKNAGCLPPEIELRKQIEQTAQLLAGMPEEAERHRTLKKLNFLIMRLNASRRGDARLDMPQHYVPAVVDRLSANPRNRAG